MKRLRDTQERLLQMVRSSIRSWVACPVWRARR